LIRLCEKFDLPTVAEDVCRIMGQKAFLQKRTSGALGWYLQAKDGGRVAQIADHFLRAFKRSCDAALADRKHEPPRFDPYDMIDAFSEIHPDLLGSDRLTFLVEYKKFHRIMETPGEGAARIKRYKTAATTLIATLVGMQYSNTAMAPCWFWLHVLLDACHWPHATSSAERRCTLLELDVIIFDVEQTHVLMRALSQLALSHNGYLQQGDVMEEIYERLRMTLARNLSRSILVEHSAH
jgi:hypothetical protein